MLPKFQGGGVRLLFPGIRGGQIVATAS
jgi:hypothetical protein